MTSEYLRAACERIVAARDAELLKYIYARLGGHVSLASLIGRLERVTRNGSPLEEYFLDGQFLAAMRPGEIEWEGCRVHVKDSWYTVSPSVTLSAGVSS